MDGDSLDRKQTTAPLSNYVKSRLTTPAGKTFVTVEMDDFNGVSD